MLKGKLVSDKRLKKSFIYSLYSVLFLFTQISFAMDKNVHIGVLAIWGEKVAQQMWQPTIDYLNKTIPNHHSF